MLDKPLEAITSDDLKDLLGFAGESTRLEFKRTLYGREDRDKLELLKDVSALANTDGGDLLIGVAQNERGIASHFEPIASNTMDSEPLRLHQILEKGLRPRIPDVKIRFVEVEPGRGLFILRAPGSQISPHQVTFQDSFKFYARNTNGTYPIEVDELRDRILRKASLAEQMVSFRRLRLRTIKFHPEDMPSPVIFERKLVTHYMPEQTFDRPGSVNAGLLTDPQIRRAVENAGAPTYIMLGLTYKPNIDGFVFMHGLSEILKNLNVKLKLVLRPKSALFHRIFLISSDPRLTYLNL